MTSLRATQDNRDCSKEIQMLRDHRNELLDILWDTASAVKEAGFPITSQVIKDMWERQRIKCTDIDKALS